MWQRELIRFWRQKSRVLGVVASPLVFWLLIGSGSGDLGRFFAGALVLTVLFSAIFSTISIIEDRREGFLLSMLVSPASRTSMVLGKILGSATLAWIQGLIFLAFAPLAGVSIGLGDVLALIGAYFPRFIYANRPRLRDRLADDFHLWISRHHEPALGAHVDGLRLIISDGDRPRVDQGRDVGESVDLFHLPAQRLVEAEFGCARCRRQPAGHCHLRFGLAARFRRGGRTRRASSVTHEDGFFLSAAGRLWLAAAGGSPSRFTGSPAVSTDGTIGPPFDSKALDGNIWVADFIYTTCPGPALA